MNIRCLYFASIFVGSSLAAMERIPLALPASPKNRNSSAGSPSASASPTNMLLNPIYRLSYGNWLPSSLVQDEERPIALFFMRGASSPSAGKNDSKAQTSPKTPPSLPNQSAALLAAYEANKKYAHDNWINMVAYREIGNMDEVAVALRLCNKHMKKAQDHYYAYLMRLRGEKSNQSPRMYAEEVDKEVATHFLKIHYLWDLESARDYWERLGFALKSTTSPRTCHAYFSALIEKERVPSPLQEIAEKGLRASKEQESPKAEPGSGLLLPVPAKQDLESAKTDIDKRLSSVKQEAIKIDNDETLIFQMEDLALGTQKIESPKGEQTPVFKRRDSGAEKFNRLQPEEKGNSVHKKNALLSEQFIKHLVSAKSFYAKWVKTLKPEPTEAQLKDLVENDFALLKKVLLERLT